MAHTLSRAQFLAVAAASLLWRPSVRGDATQLVASPGDGPARRPLRIPDRIEGDRDDDGVVRFRLDVQRGETQFRDGPTTATWGINGTYLGPTLRARRGDAVEVSVHNGLDETTTMHWHGMLLPARMDGTPHQPIEPGATWRSTWTVDQPAATLWYHPHPHGNTAKHVYRGLCGIFIVDDEGGAPGLPNTYGVDDLPVVIQDRAFDADNQFVGDGKQVGDTLLVNGTCSPFFDVSRRRLRLRLLNGSGKRVYNLGFADDRPFDLVATDGGLLAGPVRMRKLVLSTGERAEIVVELDPGETAMLRSFAHGGELDSFDVLELRATPDPDASAELPARLAGVDRLDPADAVATRTFRLTGTQINGTTMAMDRIDFAVIAGTTEIWEVVVDAGEHNFHVHGVQFQVLDIDGQPPPPELCGWKDTVAVAEGSAVRLIVPFGPYRDPVVPYMYHCHKLRHEDLGMMGQFVVVGPDEAAALPPATSHHEH